MGLGSSFDKHRIDKIMASNGASCSLTGESNPIQVIFFESKTYWATNHYCIGFVYYVLAVVHLYRMSDLSWRVRDFVQQVFCECAVWFLLFPGVMVEISLVVI